MRKNWSTLWLVMGHPIWAQWTNFQCWSVTKFVSRGPKNHLKPTKTRSGSYSCLKSALKLWSRLWLFMGNPIWANWTNFHLWDVLNFFWQGAQNDALFSSVQPVFNQFRAAETAYDSLSDVGENRVYFASKILTSCRMHWNAFLIAQIIAKCHSFPNM